MKNTIKVLTLALAVVLLICSMTACSLIPSLENLFGEKQPDVTEPEKVLVTKIDLDKTELNLSVGENATVTATVNLKATNKVLEWKTSDAAVATVDGGVVTAVGAGSATITAAATDGSGITATCTVTVIKPKTVVMSIAQVILDPSKCVPNDEITADLKLYDDGTCLINGFYVGALAVQLKYETTYEVVDGVLTFGGPVDATVMGYTGAMTTAAVVNGQEITIVCTATVGGEVQALTTNFKLTAEQIAELELATSDKINVSGISLPETLTVTSGTMFKLDDHVTYAPANATEIGYTFTIDEANATSKVVFYEEADGGFYTVNAGTITITVTSTNNPAASATMTLVVEGIERPESLATNYFENAMKFKTVLTHPAYGVIEMNPYVLNTDGTVEILHKSGEVQYLGYYTLSEDNSTITIYNFADAVKTADYVAPAYTLSKNADGLWQFDIGAVSLGVPGCRIATEVVSE